MHLEQDEHNIPNVYSYSSSQPGVVVLFIPGTCRTHLLILSLGTRMPFFVLTVTDCVFVAIAQDQKDAREIPLGLLVWRTSCGGFCRENPTLNLFLPWRS